MKAQWTAFLAMMKTSKKAQIVAVVVLILFTAMLFDVFGKKQMVDVTAYKHRESGEYIWCATGTLTNEFHDNMGQTRVEKGKESYC